MNLRPKLFAICVGVSVFTALADAAPLRLVEREIDSYARGRRTYSCLPLDGHLVPLILPPGARLEAGAELRIEWPDDRSLVVIRPATPAEVALYENMNQPEGPKLWRTHLAAIIRTESDQENIRDFQPGFLEFNHWRCGAMTLDYSLAGIRSCIMLLLWRTQDGTTLSVTLRTGFTQYPTRSEQVFGLIGGAMLLDE